MPVCASFQYLWSFLLKKFSSYEMVRMNEMVFYEHVTKYGVSRHEWNKKLAKGYHDS